MNFPASGTVRKYISVVWATWSVLFHHGSPSSLSQSPACIDLHFLPTCKVPECMGMGWSRSRLWSLTAPEVGSGGSWGNVRGGGSPEAERSTASPWNLERTLESSHRPCNWNLRQLGAQLSEMQEAHVSISMNNLRSLHLLVVLMRPRMKKDGGGVGWGREQNCILFVARWR